MSETARLPEPIRAFLAAPGRFATLATLDPDGSPRQAVVWYRFDADGRITVNTAEGRRWPANLRRDSRCALTMVDPADPYSFVALVGRVVETIDDQAVAQADIADLARRYQADDPVAAEASVARFLGEQRVTFRIEPLAAHDHLAG